MSSVPLAIIAALADEIRITLSKVRVDERVFVRPARITKGVYENNPLILVRTGIGRDAMSRAVDYCIAQYRPEICINVGYCGGARPDLVAGNVIIADRVVDANLEADCTTATAVVDRIRAACEQGGLEFCVGALVTIDEVIHEPHKKAYLGTKHEAIGIDMESHAFALACMRGSTPWAVVRAVLDPMDLTLPDLEGVLNDEGEANVLSAVKHFITKPGHTLAVPRIEYCAMKAREAIAAFIDSWLGIGVER